MYFTRLHLDRANYIRPKSDLLYIFEDSLIRACFLIVFKAVNYCNQGAVSNWGTYFAWGVQSQGEQ